MKKSIKHIKYMCLFTILLTSTSKSITDIYFPSENWKLAQYPSTVAKSDTFQTELMLFFNSSLERHNKKLLWMRIGTVCLFLITPKEKIYCRQSFRRKNLNSNPGLLYSCVVYFNDLYTVYYFRL